MLNQEEERKFAELRNRCRELGVPSPPEIMIGLQVKDADGIVTMDDVQRGHSYVRNFYNFMFMSLAEAGGSGSSNFAAGYLSGKEQGASIYYVATYCGERGPSSNGIILGNGFHNNTTTADYGIIVGTGTTAFSAEQYALATPVASGAGAGQLAYQAMAAPVQAYTAGTKTWKNTVARVFNNNSGGTIVIGETALYWKGNLPQGTAKFMFERSVLSPTVTVLSGGQLTVTYEISMDFSAID